MEELEFAKGARNLPQSLRLEIQSESKMQIYMARVEFRARLTGLRYDLRGRLRVFEVTNFLNRWLMYRWKITSFVVFSSLFWSVSLLSASLTWLVLTWVLGAAPKTEVKEESDRLVKDEPVTEEDSDSSDESVKKEESESRLLHSLPMEGETVGSGRESAEARGVQRRRSHAKMEVTE